MEAAKSAGESGDMSAIAALAGGRVVESPPLTAP